MIAETEMRCVQGEARGKIILLGEHAVVHGFPALAVGLTRGIRAAAEPSDLPFSVQVDAWNLRIDPTEDTPHGRALLALTQTLGLVPKRVKVSVTPDIPPRAGLGASAAMAVAAARSLAGYFGMSMTDQMLFDAAQASEKIFHGNPSGLDASMAIFGGISLFTKTGGLSPVNAAIPRMIIVHSGEPKDTRAAVARFAGRMKETPKESNTRLCRIGDLVRQGADALKAGDHETLGALMTENHRHLCWFNVSSPALDRIVEIAISAGALGAKMTGGGGGGCAVLLVPEDDKEIERAVRRAGFVTAAS